MPLVKVQRSGQVTIPAEIRRRARIEQGDIVDISYQNNRIIITPERVSDKNVDWTRKFNEAQGRVRRSAKRGGITGRNIDQAVKTARRGRH